MSAFAMASNFIILLQKFRKGRFFDACVDLVISGVCGLLLIGSYVGMCMAAFASLLVSIYLWFCPLELEFFSKKAKVQEAVSNTSNSVSDTLGKIGSLVSDELIPSIMGKFGYVKAN